MLPHLDKQQLQNIYTRIRIRQNLSKTEINVIAPALIRHDIRVFLPQNYEFLVEKWTEIDRKISFENDPNKSVIAAFDLLYIIIEEKKQKKNTKDKENFVLTLRFAYIQLIRTVDICIKTTKINRSSNLIYRKIGYSDASFPFDIYLQSKRIVFDAKKRRNQLKEHIRIGRRLSVLTKSLPLFLCAYSNVADKIMYVLHFILIINY
jgi:hypothetical protein